MLWIRPEVWGSAINKLIIETCQMIGQANEYVCFPVYAHIKTRLP